MALEPTSVMQTLRQLLDVPSPTGYTGEAMAWLERELVALGVTPTYSRKGALCWSVAGGKAAPKAVLAHVDTLGAMVKEIKHNGRLRLTMVGGYDWGTVEGEYCQIHTQSGRVLSGTVVNVRQSTHVWGNALAENKRSAETLEVRLDAVLDSRAVQSAFDVRALGVNVGDFVSWQPRTEVFENGYIKSRFLDNKAGVAVLLEVTRVLLGTKKKPNSRIDFVITNYEEVGHGAAGIVAPDVAEVVAVDMAAIGEGQTSSEMHCSLCVKDSSGPYDYQLGHTLRQVAAKAGIDLKVDIYPYYSSDASAAWSAGLDARCALIGPGVDASHAYERTHINALLDTGKLLLAYFGF
ncbi:MAG: M42 family metallopeptidase [Deinococcales bacterium]